jgi:hypothetical protein
MAGPAPTTLPNFKDRSAGPVHSSGWLSRTVSGLKSFVEEPRVEPLPIPKFPEDGFASTFRACLPESKRHVAAVAVHDW